MGATGLGTPRWRGCWRLVELPEGLDGNAPPLATEWETRELRCAGTATQAPRCTALGGVWAVLWSCPGRDWEVVQVSVQRRAVSPLVVPRKCLGSVWEVSRKCLAGVYSLSVAPLVVAALHQDQERAGREGQRVRRPADAEQLRLDDVRDPTDGQLA